MTVEAFAPAKVNLALHVTGRRADGYHLLDSLVVFADIGDRLRLTPSDTLTLSITGPRAAGVPVEGNLVLKAAEAVGAKAQITLEKHLPMAAGIGGGSSDAAATLRALAQMGHALPPDPERLGADVPVCLHARAARMSGIGETVTPVGNIPPLPAVLVNPGVEIPTPEIFRRLRSRENPPLQALPEDPADLVLWLAQTRNDLEPPAIEAAPIITEALKAIATSPGCHLARMSGSGATCFGLYPTDAAAHQAARALAEAHSEWWIQETTLR